MFGTVLESYHFTTLSFSVSSQIDATSTSKISVAWFHATEIKKAFKKPSLFVYNYVKEQPCKCV